MPTIRAELDFDGHFGPMVERHANDAVPREKLPQHHEADWRDRVIWHLRQDRAAISQRLTKYAYSASRIWEVRDGQHYDITDDLLVWLNTSLAALDRLLVEVGVDPEIDPDWVRPAPLL
jgi:hypothetical protein